MWRCAIFSSIPPYTHKPQYDATNIMLKKYQIEANEKFFDNVMELVKDGGIYCWVSVNKKFIKRGGKLIAEDNDAYEVVEFENSENAPISYVRPPFGDVE